ncbi:MAG: right-handed parallel beta-helix repeat-containing protein [Chitinophagaceae bacterium]|nr:right-handed parallel beta-helix repeat-containing protein [Chitinophagaceae bacterium]
MGTTDLSRKSFIKEKHYVGLQLQQGRVVTDADQIEDEEIHARENQLTQLDIIGSYGTPDNGFHIGDIINNPDGYVDFPIDAGSVYIGGLRFVLDKAETYLAQKDWQYRVGDPLKKPLLAPGQSQFDLVYLEGWDQFVTAVEDRSLLETALGTDTTTRLRRIQRVKIEPNNKYGDCSLSWSHFKEKWKDKNLGIIDRYELKTNLKLAVGFTTGDTEDLCSPSVSGGYLGAENQAIRVQVIRDQVAQKNYFTWGFDNASPLYRVKVTPGTKLVTLQNPPKDQFHWPVVGQTVEILPWSAELSNQEKVAEETGFFTKVGVSYRPDEMTFDLEDALDLNLYDDQEFFYMRIWNRGTLFNSEPLVEFIAGNTYTLGNTGLTIKFSSADAEEIVVNTGDYWIIAVRPETPDQVYPWELKEGMLPFGIRRYYAPLAIIKWTADANSEVHGQVISDCRPHFHPLTQHDCCCTYSVGDGITSTGDFNSIKDALAALPARGGKICLLPGIHTANAEIVNRSFVHISGCGLQTIVRPDINDPVKRYDPVFLVKNSQWIRIENMVIVAPEGVAVKVEDDINNNSVSREIIVRDNHIIAMVHAVRVDIPVDISSGHHVHIIYNRIGMINEARTSNGILSDVAIFSLADDVLIERNRIGIVRIKGGGGGDDGGGGGGREDECDCDIILKLSKQHDDFRAVVYDALERVSTNHLKTSLSGGYNTKGGIQVGCGSTKVLILRNEIFGGAGHGIILGHHLPYIILTTVPGMTSPTATEAQPVSPAVSGGDPLEPTGTSVPVSSQPARTAPASVAMLRTSTTTKPQVSVNGVQIDENTIIGMYLSGISTDEPDPSGGNKSIIHIGDISIYKNEIYRCALKPPIQNPDKLAQPAYGGINLAICDVVAIRENRIEDNGQSMIDPICGIYILYAHKIDISNNQILYNGKLRTTSQGINKGHRSGIFIRFVSRLLDSKADYDSNSGVTTFVPQAAADAIPVVKIHNNIVVQPLGRALTISALGSLSVLSNQFSSQGIDKDGFHGTLAGCVLIMNTAYSKTMDATLRPILYRLHMVPALSVSDTMRLSNNLEKGHKSLLGIDSGGKVLFANNQTTLDLSASGNSTCYTSQTILTRDDIGFHDNQSVALSSGKNDFDKMLVNTFLATASSVRVSDNLFDDQADATILSLWSWGTFNTTSSNQSTHCILVVGVKKIDRDNIVFSGAQCGRLAKGVAEMYGTNLANAHES